ncbi:MAG: hypothetical protein KJO40_19055 [Deltaproteobacteria bacterium]|nr:hypothetical protein [Deltaproteobacteria bacterium]NND30654.1 hypothetical protein [Myxococcales bacterium]MBT8465761.1 hypothetical protein [Deltaproteobacteria bacterium]MBT8482131.1 hypothetical protein [Deltaproteobacteria bacterium]NNK07392.1 hypothetical protein [Myxococcales bacterium]
MLRLALVFLGLVVACAAVPAADDSPEPSVEVLQPDSLAVLLSESNGLPVGVLDEQRILAGEQHILLSGAAREGRADGTDRLLRLELAPGSQLLELGGDDGEHPPIVVAFEAVAEDEIVGIELLQPSEDELRPGTWVEVDVVGVTQSGAQVRSIHPRFHADGETHLGYFAYRFDPEAPHRTLEVEALDWLERTRFRGLPRMEQINPN